MASKSTGNAILGGVIFPENTRRSASRAETERFLPAGAMTRVLWWTGAMAISLGLGVAGFATGGLAAFLMYAPPIPQMEHYKPPEMTVLLDREGEPFARLFEEQRRVVALHELPDYLPESFIAIEDTDFPHHVGVNPKAVARAAVANATSRSASQGASTITQQLARNLPTGIGREKTVQRKVREMLLALQMERRYSKDQILEVYLNQIYLGSGTYGVEAASQVYFGKSATELDRAEAALLAGLPQLPEVYSPLNNPDRAIERRNQVLERLHTLGWVGDSAYDEAHAAELHLENAAGAGPTSEPWARYFADAVRGELLRSAPVDDRSLRADGWRVRTTMDSGLQKLAMRTLVAGLDTQEVAWTEDRQPRFEKALADSKWNEPPEPGQVRMGRVVRVFPGSVVVELAGGWRADLSIPDATAHLFTEQTGIVPGAGVDVEVTRIETGGRQLWRGRLLPQQRLQGALVCLDRRTGELRALAGGREWGDRPNNGYFNRAMNARRQAGSTIKPLFYATALEMGLTPDSIVMDAPLEFGNGYRPNNYDNQFHGPTTLQDSLAHSYNVSTMRMVHDLGLRRMLERVRQFDDVNGGENWRIPLEMPVVLGTSGVTPLELASAFQAFANAGAQTPPTTLTRLENSESRPIPIPRPRERQLLDATTSAHMTQMLIRVMTHGTGRGVRSQLPEALQDAVAGKSGTTSDNRDAWFVGFTPDYVVAVWIGFDQPLPLGATRTGGRAAGTIWGQFVADAWNELPHGDGDPALSMPEGWTLALLDTETGERLDPTEWTAGGTAVWRAKLVGR